jgi:hypothetical protein
MNDYTKIVEGFRHHYFIKHGVKLDDELLYFFIRMNEMQVDLKKDIKAIPKITFRSGHDYFLYGLGKITAITVIGAWLFAISLLVAHCK